jgi:pSer/pThr/pTyr-binding forkhead associated (FHA) protein
MIEVVLTYPAPDGSEEIPLENGRISMGRGSDADLRFDDDGLSRLHASVYREGDKVWVLDEGSTNGTLVNGKSVPPSGVPLRNGDSISIGHYTNIRVFITERREAQSSATSPISRSLSSVNSAFSATVSKPSAHHIVPIAVTLFALLVIGVAAIFIGVKVFSSSEPEIVYTSDKSDSVRDETDTDEDKTPTPKNKEITKTETSKSPEATATPTVSSGKNETNNTVIVQSGKKYQQMTDEEKNRYIQEKAENIASLIGNRNSDAISPTAIGKIKGFLDGYVGRIRSSKVNDCSAKGWLKSDMVSVLERASQNAPFVNRAFIEQGMDSRVGLYLAMIESEHCSCLQSGTGPLGMFQFTFATGQRFFQPNTGIIKGSSPSSPDDRCKPEPAAKASARYMKYLLGFFGTGPLSVPLAIGSYNSGEGAGAKNLREAMAGNESQERNFWTLIANADKLGTQFQLENFKYVPKFFAAAIIGENPQDFGISLPPLSSR